MTTQSEVTKAKINFYESEIKQKEQEDIQKIWTEMFGEWEHLQSNIFLLQDKIEQEFGNKIILDL